MRFVRILHHVLTLADRAVDVLTLRFSRVSYSWDSVAVRIVRNSVLSTESSVCYFSSALIMTFACIIFLSRKVF